LRDLTIVGQDWGGPIALRYAIEHVDPRAMENYLSPQDMPVKRAGLANFPKRKSGRD
jgi:pimeloyl-ACP methyl ester carboxylesterase